MTEKEKQIIQELEEDRRLNERRKSIDKLKNEIIFDISSIFNKNLALWIFIYIIAFKIYNENYLTEYKMLSLDFICLQIPLFMYMLIFFYSISTLIFINKNNLVENYKIEEFDIKSVLKSLTKITISTLLLLFLIGVYYVLM